MGDVGQPELAQQPGSLAGKILRLNADGSVPADNPFAGSPVYSLGHRNPQGLAWDRKGRLIAAEHGSSGRDEINHIRPGANYGWPRVVGKAGDARYADPIIESGRQTWAPSGIAIRGDDLFVAGLRSQQLLRMTLGPDLEITHVAALLERAHGRLRDVVVGPDGALYVTTSNRDGTGELPAEDDRILKVTP
jgi:glucose/arabinose dehydrogenase